MTKGWHNESKRHSLARKGIKTGRKNIPNWLFDNIKDKKDKQKAIEQWKGGIPATDLAKDYGVKNPFLTTKRPPIFWSDKQKIDYLKKLANKLGRTPTQKDVVKDKNSPAISPFVHSFGSWNKALIKAGLEPTKIHRYKLPLEEKIKIKEKQRKDIQLQSQYKKKKYDTIEPFREDVKETYYKYAKSPKGMERMWRYYRSEAGKATRRKFNKSKKRKEIDRRYGQTERRKELKRKAMVRFKKKHPNYTTEWHKKKYAKGHRYIRRKKKEQLFRWLFG